MDDTPLSAIILFLGGLCWVSSLWFPALYTDTSTLMGYWVLVAGWLGIVAFQFGWFANLLIFLSVLWMYKYPIRATLIAAAAVLVATQSFWFTVMPGKYENVNVIGQGTGFWLWYGSLILMCIGVIFGSDSAHDKEPTVLTPPANPVPSANPDITLPNPAAVVAPIIASNVNPSTTTKPMIEAPLIAANDDHALVTKPVAQASVDEPTPLADLLGTPPPPSRS